MKYWTFSGGLQSLDPWIKVIFGLIDSQSGPWSWDLRLSNLQISHRNIWDQKTMHQFMLNVVGLMWKKMYSTHKLVSLFSLFVCFLHPFSMLRITQRGWMSCCKELVGVVRRVAKSVATQQQLIALIKWNWTLYLSIFILSRQPLCHSWNHLAQGHETFLIYFWDLLRVVESSWKCTKCMSCASCHF